MTSVSTDSVMRFPQGVSKPVRELAVPWRRAWYFGARAAVLDLPGSAIFVIPKRATVTGKRYWYLACVHTNGRVLPDVYCCVTRRALRDTVQRTLARLGWEAVL